MKILYITQMISNEGGVQKVLAVKTNYLIEKYGYQIDVLTQDKGNTDLFFEFNPKIGLFDMVLSKNKIFKFFQYRNYILKQIITSKPNVIVVCDASLKAYFLPLLIKTKTPIIFEIHGSKFNESQNFKQNLINVFFRKIKYKIKNILVNSFNKLVALSKESSEEWNTKNCVIIPNALENSNNEIAVLNAKKVIAVARHSYEKGLDRLLKIWQKVSLKHPDWFLEIYGSGYMTNELKNQTENLRIEKSVHFFDPIKDVHLRYLTASIYVMTSRQEGFPMVLLEAMNAGLPVIAYDCPIGPRSIITDNVDGFLIQDGNENEFVEKINQLIEDETLRKRIGKNAKESVSKYQIDEIMNQWHQLFCNGAKISNSEKVKHK